jgi:hypothetical protein
VDGCCKIWVEAGEFHTFFVLEFGTAGQVLCFQIGKYLLFSIQIIFIFWWVLQIAKDGFRQSRDS